MDNTGIAPGAVISHRVGKTGCCNPGREGVGTMRISSTDWVYIGIAILLIMVLYQVKPLRPLIIVVVLTIAVGIMLRFEPQVVEQTTGAINILAGR